MSSSVPTSPPGYVAPTTATPYATQPAVPVAPVTAPTEAVADGEIRIYGHNNLFYWWPVWVVGFLMAALTYVDGHYMAVVPEGTKAERWQGPDGNMRDVLVPPEKAKLPPAGASNDDATPGIRVAANNNYGVIFTFTLVLVVMITNFTLRGMASLIVIAFIVIVALLFAQLGWWDQIFRSLGNLDVRMNAGGYLVFAVPLFVIWLFSTYVYDRYTYLIVTRGQVRIRKEIGDGELAVDSTGLTLEKKRDDLFRHWLIGLGSGDLHIKTGGPANLDFELYNVLFLSSKMARIQDMLREKEVAQQFPNA